MRGGTWRTSSGYFVTESDAYLLLGSGSVVLLGELHDSARDHSWQAEVIRALAGRQATAVGFEMFPWTAQPALDAWSRGELDFAGLIEAVRWAEVWGYDPELYRPVLEACRAASASIFGLNVDRAIVKAVRNAGWGALPAAESAWLSPAAAPRSAYRRYLFEMTGGARPDRAAKDPADPAFDGFVRAQQVWDRAFACRIASALSGEPGRLVIGIIGRGHLEYGFGVPDQLADLGVGAVRVALPEAEGMVPGEGPIADLAFRGAGS